jgi:hypothetical protein
LVFGVRRDAHDLAALDHKEHVVQHVAAPIEQSSGAEDDRFWLGRGKESQKQK